MLINLTTEKVIIVSVRVLIAGFKHETNTFSQNMADLAAYRARALYEDNDIDDVDEVDT